MVAPQSTAASKRELLGREAGDLSLALWEGDNVQVMFDWLVEPAMCTASQIEILLFLASVLCFPSTSAFLGIRFLTHPQLIEMTVPASHETGYIEVGHKRDKKIPLKLYYEKTGNGPKKLLLVMGLNTPGSAWEPVVSCQQLINSEEDLIVYLSI